MTNYERATTAINFLVDELRKETNDPKLLKDETNHLISSLIERYTALANKNVVPTQIVTDRFKTYLLGAWRTMEAYSSSCRRYYLYVETLKLWDLAVLQFDRSSSHG